MENNDKKFPSLDGTNKNGIELDEETLRLEGLRWEMSHSGRNGRTAQQFVNYFLGQR